MVYISHQTTKNKTIWIHHTLLLIMASCLADVFLHIIRLPILGPTMIITMVLSTHSRMDKMVASLVPIPFPILIPFPIPFPIR